VRPEPVGVATVFEVTELDDLVLLQRAIAAARFVSRESDVLLGSPRMAWLHCQVVDAIVVATGEAGSVDSSGWAAWRRLSNNAAHADQVVDYLAGTKRFFEWSREDQLAFVKVCIAPFEASDSEIEDLLTKAAASSEKQG
jgi:hypothetical protein